MDITNCPNCGAVRTGHKCEYCGTIFSDPQAKLRRIAIEEALTASRLGIMTINEAKERMYGRQNM